MPDQSPGAAVAVILVNALGELLLQHRDHQASVGPGRWSTVGGAIELGEKPSAAAHRELVEETSLVDQRLELWTSGELAANSGTGLTKWSVFVGATSAVDADIVVGEGLDIMFVPTDQVRLLDLLPAARHFLELFLASPELRRLTTSARPLR